MQYKVSMKELCTWLFDMYVKYDSGYKISKSVNNDWNSVFIIII